MEWKFPVTCLYTFEYELLNLQIFTNISEVITVYLIYENKSQFYFLSNLLISISGFHRAFFKVSHFLLAD